jgi:hypothetical protein
MLCICKIRFEQYQRNNLMRVFLVLVCLALCLTGCADHLTFNQAASRQPVGFWYGLWHGTILPFAWIVSLFNKAVAIYAIYNNGGWYDFGYLLGAAGFLGGGVGVAELASSK